MGKKGLGGHKGCLAHTAGSILDLGCKKCKLASEQAFNSSRKIGLWKKSNEFRELTGAEIVTLYKRGKQLGGFFPMGSKRTIRLLKRFIRALKKHDIQPLPPIVIGKFVDTAVRNTAMLLPKDELARKKTPKTPTATYTISDLMQSFGPDNYKVLKRTTIKA
jgi:hypothetical protein